MHILISVFYCLIIIQPSEDKIRSFEFNNSKVRTTYGVEDRFYGKYRGAKKGFLNLKKDGTGQYLYDVFGFAPDHCKKDTIDFEWGFIIDENDQLVNFEREYGLSYPIIYRSTGNTSWQGCTKKVFLDYLLVYKTGEITVSSSDDWIHL